MPDSFHVILIDVEWFIEWYWVRQSIVQPLCNSGASCLTLVKLTN